MWAIRSMVGMKIQIWATDLSPRCGCLLCVVCAFMTCPISILFSEEERHEDRGNSSKWRLTAESVTSLRSIESFPRTSSRYFSLLFSFLNSISSCLEWKHSKATVHRRDSIFLTSSHVVHWQDSNDGAENVIEGWSFQRATERQRTCSTRSQ